jgi:hypothetical protein
VEADASMVTLLFGGVIYLLVGMVLIYRGSE